MRAALRDMHVDGFGHRGSRLIWNAVGVPAAPPSFCERAQQQISETIAVDGLAVASQVLEHDIGASCGPRKHRRVFAYAEYDLELVPGAAGRIQGKLLFENGFQSARANAQWFRHTPLPINTWVDRSLCAEAQLLAAFCTQQLADGRPPNALKGRLRLYTTSPPCASCVGVLWQFRLLLRNLELEVESGSGRGLEAWAKC